MAGNKSGTAPLHLAGTLIVLSLLAQGAPARSADVQRGHEIADRWCASCHIVDNKGTGTAADRAPPFPELSADLTKTPSYLRGFLTVPHYPMPDLQLSNRDIEDLVAYIDRLKKTKTP